MTLFLSDNSKTLEKLHSIMKLGLTFLALCCSFNIQAALTPLPIPEDYCLTGNPLRVQNYIDSLPIYPGSDLAHVICELPLDEYEYIEALDHMHPALLQNLTLMTNENMQTVRQIFLGRNSFLRFDKCKTFDSLYGDCNLGPSQMWITPFGLFLDQASICKLVGYRATTPGLMIGVDSQPNKHTVLGFGIGYSWSDLHWKKAYGNADCQTAYFGVYGSTMYDHFYADAAVLGSYEFYKTVRHIEFSKFEDKYDDFYCKNKPKYRCRNKKGSRRDCQTGDCETGDCHPRDHRRCKDEPCRVCQLDDGEGEFNQDCCPRPPPKYKCGIDRNPRSRFRGYGILSHIGIGGKLNICGLDIIPFASMDYNFVDQDGHREYKARSLNLVVKANHAHLLRTEAGLTLKGCIPYNCAWVRPSATLSYVRRTILQGNRFRARFHNYGDSCFEAFGSKQPLGYVAAGIGLETQFTSQYILSLNYDAELNRQQTTQRLTLRFQRAY